jgi:hypothetical protein
MPTATAAANSHTAVLNSGWASPSNAFASSGDNVYATAAPSSNQTKTGDFKFPSLGIATDVTVTAVRVVCEGKLSTATAGRVLGIRGGGASLDPNAETTLTETTTETQLTFSFGTLPSIAQLNTAGYVFARVRASRSSGSALTASLDYVRLEVDYTEPITPKTSSDSGAGTEATSLRAGIVGTTDTGVGTSGSGTPRTAWVRTDTAGLDPDIGENATRVAESTIVTLLSDDMTPDSASGWGAPDVGPAPVENILVDNYKSGGKGIQRHGSGNLTRSVRWQEGNAISCEMTGEFSIDKVPTGSNFDAHMGVRVITSIDYYRMRFRVKTDATLWLQIDKVVDNGSGVGTATALGTDTQVGSGYVANQVWKWRVQAIGFDATTIRAKAWISTAPEPSGWVQTEDAASFLQSAGGFTVRTFQSGISNAPILASWDNVLATTLDLEEAPVVVDTGAGTETSTTVVKIIAQDAFGTSSGSGLANATVGGAYTVNDATKVTGTGTTASFAHGAASANTTLSARLASVSSQASRFRFRAQWNTDAVAGNEDVHWAGRMIGASDYYRLRLRLEDADQHVYAQIDRVVAGAATPLIGADADLGAYGTTGSDWWWGELEVTGAAGATPRLQGKAWKHGTSEPASYTWDVDDSGYAPGAYPTGNDLRGPGHVGIRTFNGAGSTTSLTVLVDDLYAIDPGDETTTTPLTGDAEDGEGTEEYSTVDTGFPDETGTATDVVSIRGIASTDSGAGTDAGTPTYTHVRTDSGAGTDASPVRGIGRPDSGAGTDDSDLTQVEDPGEGSGDDAIVVTFDNAVGTDAISQITRVLEIRSSTSSSVRVVVVVTGSEASTVEVTSTES